MCHDWFVPRINIRQLRDTRKLKAWLRAGKTVELRERGRLIARIIPQGRPRERVEVPDCSALREETFGNRVFSGADLLIEQRGRF
jgi:antitoxin (DNA-binding transcriptional repressor) of toxin-antitoxin stability system